MYLLTFWVFQINGNELLQQVLSLISKSKEFSDMRLRVDEKKCLNLLNKTKNENSIRFPFNGKIKTLDMKINWWECVVVSWLLTKFLFNFFPSSIIQAIFGCLEIEDQSIVSEAFRIMRLGERICRCEYGILVCWFFYFMNDLGYYVFVWIRASLQMEFENEKWKK